MSQEKEKELTQDSKELAKDPAVNVVEEVQPTQNVEVKVNFTEEEKASGIASGKFSGEKNGAAVGIRVGEEDSVQKKSE